ncbi:MAG: aspartate kinase [Flavobacteriales bacterium]|jgi:aspartate kinase
MIVYKFGGASVKDAAAIRNVGKILLNCEDEHAVIVQSAMGKMTNHLEAIWRAWTNEESTENLQEEFITFHYSIAEDLALNQTELIGVNLLVGELKALLAQPSGGNSGLAYDQVVCFGELVGTSLVQAGLTKLGISIEWFDARHVLKTDSAHRNADIDWERSKLGTDILKAHFVAGERNLVLTQGFIAQSKVGNTTTLGREGSDYSSAIFAHLLNAESLTIWKDVPGMLNADPRWFNNTICIEELSFREAIELSYYGASVIHPKTIKPLQNKDIPLRVKSFVDPALPGTIIKKDVQVAKMIPMYIFKPKQILISISPRDFSFIVESNLRDIFEALTSTGVSVNLMQNSAISFSVCVDQDIDRITEFIELMKSKYAIKYNEEVELLTIRHYDEPTVKQLTGSKEVLVEQKSRQTLRMVLRPLI